MTDDASNRIVDWLEQVSAKEGYDEARQFRRDIVDAMGVGGVSWDGLSSEILASGMAMWLSRARVGGFVPGPIPAEYLGQCIGRVHDALQAHSTETNRPATLSVEQFGDGIQVIWQVLTAQEPEKQAPEAQSDIAKFSADFKLGG